MKAAQPALATDLAFGWSLRWYDLRGNRNILEPSSAQPARQLKRNPLGGNNSRNIKEMINPELRDWWSLKHITEIKYKGNAVIGAGVSMQVISTIFVEKDYIWFSKVYGMFNDNLIMFAFKPEEVLHQERIEYEKDDKKRLFFGQPMKNEYQITEEITQQIGLEANNDGLNIQNKEKCEIWVYSHDNFIFQIEPINNSLLERLVQAILLQHNYYLREEINWKDIDNYLISVLLEKGVIELQSDPMRKYMWISQLEKDKHLFWKMFRKGTIIIKNKTAKLRDQE